MSTCTKCAGDGLIGNGPKPWLREGHVTTCDQCSGTGKVADAPKSAPENSGAAPVDKPAKQETPRRGILSIFRR